MYISIGLPAEFFELTPLLLFFRLRPSGDIPVTSPIIARIFFVGLYFSFASYILVLWVCIVDIEHSGLLLYFSLRIFSFLRGFCFLRCSGVGCLHISLRILYRLSILNCVDCLYVELCGMLI